MQPAEYNKICLYTRKYSVKMFVKLEKKKTFQPQK